MQFVLSIFLSITNIALVFYPLMIIQQEGYKFKYNRKILIYYSLVSSMAIIDSIVNYIAYKRPEIGLVFQIALSAVFLILLYRKPFKKPLVFTERVIRIIIISFLINIIIGFCWLAIAKLNYIKLACFIYIFALPSIYIAIFILEPFERKIKKEYIINCKADLNKRKNIKIVGITGSFGKTSVKNFLYKILSVKHKTFMTPHNYNTPMGVCLSVAKMSDDVEIFICEMGARKIGDIKELVEMVNPDYGILTGITSQHLETFKSLDNIIKEKSVLNFSIDNNITIYNIDNKIVEEIYESDKNPFTVSAGALGLVSYRIVSVSAEGTNFIIKYQDKEMLFHTCLIGTHNISNICCASAFALSLGLCEEELAKGINNIGYVEHRLQISSLPNGAILIDDSYNSNIEGVKCLTEVLSNFSGKKTVVTPGIVEGGKSQDSINVELGKLYAKSVNEIILIGKNSNSIKKGLLENKYCGKIYEVKNLESAKQFFAGKLNKGDVLVFENDLTDNF